MPVMPQTSDESWLAVDTAGHVGWFTVNGAGPVLLRPGVDAAHLFAAEEAFGQWLRSEGHHFTFGDAGQWRAAAAAGIFAFDHHASEGYKLVARPTNPRTVDALPRELADVVRLVDFQVIELAAVSLVGERDLALEDQ